MAEQLYDPELEVNSVFSRAWEVFKAHLWPTVAVFVIFSLLSNVGTVWDDDGGLGNIIGLLITGPITAGTYMYALRLVRGGEADLGEMFRGFQVFGRALGVFLLYAAIIVVGLIFLIIPGIYMAVALYPAMYLVLDDDLSVTDTLRKAWSMTESYRGRMFIVFLAVVGLNLLGLIALVIGVIFTGALSLLIGATVYEELAGTYSANHPVDIVG